MYDHGCTLLAAMVMELWMFNFFFPHCQEDFTPERQPRRCWFNPVKSDYGGNPDDQQAMVRYLLDDLVTSPWRAMMVSKKGPILCWARALKGSSLASEREHDRNWSHILLQPLSDINIRCQLDPSLFFWVAISDIRCTVMG